MNYYATTISAGGWHFSKITPQERYVKIITSASMAGLLSEKKYEQHNDFASDLVELSVKRLIFETSI